MSFGKCVENIQCFQHGKPVSGRVKTVIIPHFCNNLRFIDCGKISYTVRKMFTDNSSITHKCFNRMRRQPAAAVRKGLWKVPVKKRNVRLDSITDTAVCDTVIKGKSGSIDGSVIAIWKNPGP